ncbi:MAG: cell cycle regulatory protein GcrA [Hyphococcus sp.]|nr:MAG: cell cycle regulatory protein GcrA [Marinicaulis sp.]
MAWTDERVELLKKLWAEGLSAAQIANKMGGVTRNAVIGKVHRLGLSGRATPAKPQRGCAPSAERKEASPVKERRPEVKSVIPEPEFIAPLVLDTGDRTTVSTIKNNMCKWPIGDPARDDFHFCGQSTLSGKSYCAYHAHLAFQPPQRREARREPRRVLANPEKRRAAS